VRAVPAPPRTGPAREVRAARWAVLAVFVINGSYFGAWATRIPAIRDRLDLTDGQLGLGLGAIALGAIVAMPIAGAVAARIGSRRATRAATVLATLGTAAVALSPSFAGFLALALLFGVGMGSLDVTMNVHGVTVERRYGRPILGGLHAGFSAGGLLGGAVGGIVAALGVDPRVHLALWAAMGGGVMLAWSRRLLPSAKDAGAASEPFFVRPPRRLWALGALAFAGLLVEGATGDWSAVYLRDELGASAGAAAAGFTAFSLAMVLGRASGDRLVQALGPVRMVRAGGTIAATGFGLALVLATPPAAVLGFASLGIGVSCIVPLVFRAAGAVRGLPAGVALGAVSSMGYLGLMAGPPLVGGLAELTSLPRALWLLVGLAGVVAVLGRTARVDAAPQEVRSAGPATVAA
jgi:MFS family permease